MNYKIVGSALIITSCGGFGLSLAAGCRQQEQLLSQLIQILEYMEYELQYRLTPLPDLCRSSSKNSTGILRHIFLDLARELDWNTAPDVQSCMAEVIHRYRNLPQVVRSLLYQLGCTLGKFDFPGQIKGLRSVLAAASNELHAIKAERNIRLRNYRTLGFCAGAALAILLA